MIAVALYTGNNNRTQVKVFAIDFPPGIATPIVAATTSYKGWYLLLIMVSVLLLVMAARALIKKQRLKPAAIQLPTPTLVVAPAITEEPAIENTETITASAIYLFGNFEVYDNTSHDITTQFTPLLKELLLMIVTHTVRTGKGIAQEKLFDILWRDKEVKDAKNNYSVNIAKLKHILESIGVCHIEKVNGKIQFVAADNGVYMDYHIFMDIIRKTACTPAENRRLLKILERGSFLNEVNYSWLDDIKSEVSGMAIDWLLANMATHVMTDSSEIIRLANAVFLFDQLNETALEYKCKALIAQGRYGLALETFQKFEKEYEHSYGEKPGKKFNEIANG
jgi:two-component SAPR family response regulator